MGRDGTRSLWDGRSRPMPRNGTGRNGTRALWDGRSRPGPVASLQEHEIEVTLSTSRSEKTCMTDIQSVEDLFQQLLIQFNSNHQELVDQTLLNLIVI